MAIRKILQATDPRGEVILRRKSKKVRAFDKDLQHLVDDMIETMRSSHGVGLAAPQVGELKRVVVAELPAEKERGEDGEEVVLKPAQLFTLCNPEITFVSPEKVVGEEGCLSLAGLYAQVPRSLEVEVRFQDLKGRRRKLQAEGYLARVLQHEIDHLEGVLFPDRVEDLTTFVRYTEDGPEAVLLEEVPVADRAG